MLIKLPKNSCGDCAYVITGKCKSGKKCGNYIDIQPTCDNCGKKVGCKKFGKLCKKWEADLDDSFVQMLLKISRFDDIPKEIAGKLDTRDFKKSPNFLAHCLDRIEIEPYPRQLQIGLVLFCEICPACSNPDYFNLFDQSLDNIMDNLAITEWGICPRCGKNRFQIIEENDWLHWHNELVGVAGQRSGKTELNQMLCSYLWEWYTFLPGIPSQTFGLSKTTKLSMTFVAITFKQAKDTLWDPFLGSIRNNSWLHRYHKYIEEKSEELGIPEQIRIEDTFIVYNHKNLRAIPTGPDKRINRGYTRFEFSIDELGWFTGGEHAVKLNPDEVYKALSNSLKTIRIAVNSLKRKQKEFVDIPQAFSINISSPRASRDGIMRLLYQSRKIPSMYAFHFPTWEMNPNTRREDFEDEFAKDPKAAQRDFGAFPPLIDSPYITSILYIRERYEKASYRNAIKYKTTLLRKKSKTGESFFTSARIAKTKFSGRPMVIGIDAGYSGNSFGLVCASLNLDFKVDIEGVLEIMPSGSTPVNFNYTYENVISPLIAENDIVVVVFDRWQSIDLSHRILDDFGIEAIRYSLRYADFDLNRQRFLGGQVILPKPEVKDWDQIMESVPDYPESMTDRPVSHFYLQWATVQDSGRRVEKSQDFEDDVFRASQLAITYALDENLVPLMLSGTEKRESASGGAMLMVGMSGNSNSRSMGGQRQTLRSHSMGLVARRNI